MSVIEWAAYLSEKLKVAAAPPVTKVIAPPPEMIDDSIVNCRLCGTGKNYWHKRRAGVYICPTCNGNPLRGDGDPDWRINSRMRAVQHFGPRMDGDYLLMRGDVNAYKRWLQDNPESAPYGMLP